MHDRRQGAGQHDGMALVEGQAAADLESLVAFAVAPDTALGERLWTLSETLTGCRLPD
jgi:hypothetical protein